MPRKQHIVELKPEQRGYLTRLISSSETSAYTQSRAYVLLKADAQPSGPGWDDARIAEAFMVSVRTVERTRRRYAERGLPAALARKPQERELLGGLVSRQTFQVAKDQRRPILLR